MKNSQAHPDTLGENSPADPSDDKLVRRIREAADLLQEVAADRSLLASVSELDQRRLIHAAGEVWTPDPAQRRALTKVRAKRRAEEARAAEEAKLNQRGIRKLRRRPTFTTPNIYPPVEPEALPPARDGGMGEGSQEIEAGKIVKVDRQHCYVCKEAFYELHHFYDQLCPPCAAFNFAKREELADLNDRVALVTGGRVKIGYQAVIKLLRSGADVMVTTRFPRDAAARYAREPDFPRWGHRLRIYGVDLRHTPSVEAFCAEIMATRSRLDFIVNNACQTVRRPPEFYAHMMEGESSALDGLPDEVLGLLGSYGGRGGEGLLPGRAPEPSGISPLAVERSAALSQIPLLPEERIARHALFPEGAFDQDLQQVDLRETNSWRMLMADVPTVELLEVHLVNAVAPFILNARLKPLMLRTQNRDKHIINVSAVEGQFYRNAKTTRHPHTNMAKAALNMMTRTAAADYHGDGIHMNAVDTGWVTDEDPEAIAARKTELHRFHPPLDIVDGAARIVDPIIHGFNSGTHVWGHFLKDYRPTDW